MKLVGTIDPKSVWRCSPELASATTSITSQVSTIQTAPEIVKEINDRVARIEEGLRIHGVSGTFKGDENMEINGMVFKDFEKNLRKLGIDIITIRHCAGDVGCEIEGYFNPSVYKKYLDDEKVTCVSVRPYKPALTKTPKTAEPTPKKVIFSGPATTILWKDGTKTTVKCQDEDVWADDVGVAMCYLKKMLGNKGNFNNIFREAMKVSEVQTKKEELASSTAIEGESYYSSALDSMKRNIDEINDFMKDAANALDKALGGKK